MGPPARAGILTVPTLGLPLLLALKLQRPGASGNLSQRGREEGGPTGAGEPALFPTGCRSLAAVSPRVSSGFQKWGILKIKSPKFSTLATN